MRFSEAYGPGKFGLSFELFPPKTPTVGAGNVRPSRDLMRFEPAYMTCTYGAGGSTRDKTLEIVERVRRESRTPVASHLTCVGSTVDELRLPGRSLAVAGSTISSPCVAIRRAAKRRSGRLPAASPTPTNWSG